MMPDDLPGFIWFVFRDPIIAAVAVASAIIMMVVISTWFNFKSPTEEE